MTVAEHLAKDNGTTRLSYELLPPIKGSSIETIFSSLDRLAPFHPPFINITYHREEVSYLKQPNGSQKPVVVRRRPGTVAIAAAIQFRYKIDVVPHIICGGFSFQETEDALIDLDFLGIRNLLVVRGDADKITGVFSPNPNGHGNASGLLEQIMNMNKGVYHENCIENPVCTNFSVGVAGYPEKHPESPNMEDDLQYLKQKVDKGAQYIVTQMFYDNSVFFTFVKRCRELGIKVPIIPGLKPISIREHIQRLPRTFHLTVPQPLVKEISLCKNNAQIKEAGIEWTVGQIKELASAGHHFIHIYTMGNVDNVAKISERVL